VVVDEDTHKQLLSLAEEDPTTTVTIDLDTQSVILPDGRRAAFPIDGFSKTCLIEGLDQLGYLLKQAPSIDRFEAANPARVQTAAAP
jgi:3-isopropylmalate/(R)-2-methylmalate dehydratase small subunit